jgi:hypothetical protein
MRVKDMWIAEFEKLIAELEGKGLSFNQAYKQASDLTDARLRDRLADMADAERKRRKEEGQ